MSDDRIAALEATVHDLIVEVKRLRAHRGSMAQTHRCTACGGGSLVHFTQVLEETRRGLEEFSLQQKPAFYRTKHLAPTSAYACRQCGLVEWHAKLDDLKLDDPSIELIEAPAEAVPERAGPFR